MNSNRVNGARQWSTSAFGGSAETSPEELAEMAEHLGQCEKGRNLIALCRSGMEALARFTSRRVVTSSLLGIALLATIAAVMVWR